MDSDEYVSSKSEDAATRGSFIEACRELFPVHHFIRLETQEATRADTV